MIKKSVIILAGGQNSRMNYKTKAFLKYKGSTFLDRTLEATSSYKQTIISCNDLEGYDKYSNRAKLVQDNIFNIGPLAGIYAALNKSKYEYALVVASDMPFLDKEFLDFLGNYKFNEDALIPIVNNKPQPLCGIYKKSITPVIFELIKNKDYSIRALHRKLNIRYLKVANSENFININTTLEYKDLIKKGL